MIDLNSMTLSELKDLAKENNIKNISKLKKEDLIGILQQISVGDSKSIEVTKVLSGFTPSIEYKFN